MGGVVSRRSWSARSSRSAKRPFMLFIALNAHRHTECAHEDIMTRRTFLPHLLRSH